MTSTIIRRVKDIIKPLRQTGKTDQAMEKQIAILSGDGIGPEVMAEALKVLKAVGDKFGHTFKSREALIGGAAFDEFGEHYPAVTKAICAESDAILFGSVGGPVNEMDKAKWNNCEANSLLALRQSFSFNANLRPVKVYKELENICPLKKEVIGDGVDMLIVRELLGDLYFGEHVTKTENGEKIALDVAQYSEKQIESVAHIAFKAAQKRSKKLTSVDKANVLDVSKLWREVVNRVSKQYEDVELEHMLVDNCAMQLIKCPTQFDVILAGNMFGDILSDAAAILPGSLGLLPSASLNKDGFGYYEPSGGSAQDIAGKGIANPIAQILSLAMMLKHSFDMNEEADSITNAVNSVLKSGKRTKDIYCEGTQLVGTGEMGDLITTAL